MKSKDIVEHCKVNFLISANVSSNVIQSKLFIQCNTESCCEHITGSININLCAVSVHWPVCTMCLCLSMCDIKLEYKQKAKSYVRPQQIDALLHKTHRKVHAVLRYQGLTCVDPKCHLVKSSTSDAARSLIEQCFHKIRNFKLSANYGKLNWEVTV